MKNIRGRTKRVSQSKQARFGVVGIINTAVDFIVLNILVSFFGVSIVPANIISTTSAMLTSFGLNRKVVFRASEGSAVRQLALFFVVSLTSIWLVQSTVMLGAFHILQSVTPWHHAVLLNIAKLCGISVGFVWNYLGYNYLVFRGAKSHKR
ncbi:MAG: GtrA family protein [Candidatus Saccharimonadales bacterium]